MNVNREYISTQNTYQGLNSPKYIVIHETDNWGIGAGAQRHAKAQAAGHLTTSVQYYSGSDGVYQTAEHYDGTYSVGREYGGDHTVKDATNRNTINIEICVNKDGDYNMARANAIELVKYLIQVTGIPAERVIRHYDAKGKYCPRNMMDDPSLWEDFKAQIGGTAGVADAVDKPSNPYQVPERVIKYKTKGIMTGNDVKWVQWELQQAGYDLEVDGKFGPVSDAALQAYQLQHGLEVDGKCGPKTKACMIMD